MRLRESYRMGIWVTHRDDKVTPQFQLYIERHPHKNTRTKAFWFRIAFYGKYHGSSRAQLGDSFGRLAAKYSVSYFLTFCTSDPRVQSILLYRHLTDIENLPDIQEGVYFLHLQGLDFKSEESCISDLGILDFKSEE